MVKGEEKREVVKARLIRRGLRFRKKEGRNKVKRDIKIIYNIDRVKKEN